MTDSIQIHRKKASFILAVSITSYSVIATYLYNCHQINLVEYTTPNYIEYRTLNSFMRALSKIFLSLPYQE